MRHLKLAAGILLIFMVLITGPAQAVKVDLGDDTSIESIQIAIPISIAIIQPHSPLDFDLIIEWGPALPPEEEWVTI